MNADAVDGIVEQWARERPGMAVDSIGVIARILRIAKLITDERRRVLAELGIDSATLDLLATLRRAGDPYRLTPAEIAEKCLVSGGAITQRVARAEDAGLVRTQRSASGKRTVAVELTAHGHQVIEHDIEVLIDRERRLIAGLPADDRHQLEGLLRELLGRMSSE
ncbi:DNA-binding transcriptional regulator, MarR family [Saccharopolyspora kobensis]|uniref:DNA-binding transcriptional regulator, MarR family n=1 Tax=Saccharopolyspora kobensis TaxID=146035 RepID=A0A1H5UP05_9PSEU|nr:MarR family transcriptional regulator [Saccharopolyspora kobensis]SEF76823.1 DNA-binding transcriptional regulator, MarR family [Saccharopolyspora kobensis]SFC71249.1 DNA-binding transcriptional regulator, MarR family [Saccharopolyspora kobensis]